MVAPNDAPVLAHGMELLELPAFPDDRGRLTELYRRSWGGAATPVQWNCVRSRPGIMRGIHVHLGYEEYYLVLAGRMYVGWRDLRRGSPTEGRVGGLELGPEPPRAVRSPPGVAHGLLFLEESLLLVGTTREWDLAAELGCHWKDPGLGIPWPRTDARLSAADAARGSLAELAARVPPWSPG